MKYALLVLAPPGSASYSALHFARAALERGHSIERVFFLDDGVNNGLDTTVPPQGERDIPALWGAFARETGVELVLCVSSAVRRGLLDATEAQRHEKPGPTVTEGFTIGGLGLLLEASVASDRVLTFGGQA
ncbi:sulfurtransferase complex subunit TusD [Parahaliea maris]|uniref:Sulfurtransferase complex subunit TusD n=1 Tax=Parahaliea maris TaxID=2716870 RepID=A0A5C8ZZJ2_9GAMM|nr:sulfurtransferase complex subunit TusD [Parahaliea maris]TXS93042.1 sulfurtransferase complex subunit TusD [Parahaliea maris]